MGLMHPDINSKRTRWTDVPPELQRPPRTSERAAPDDLFSALAERCFRGLFIVILIPFVALSSIVWVPCLIIGSIVPAAWFDGIKEKKRPGPEHFRGKPPE